MSSLQEETARSSCRAGIIEPFFLKKKKKDKQYCQNREGRISFIPLPDAAKLLAAEPVPEPGYQVPNAPKLWPPVQRDTKLPLDTGTSRKSLWPLGQLFAAATPRFHCHNPTEFYSSSMTSYLFLFLSIYLALLPMGNYEFLALFFHFQMKIILKYSHMQWNTGLLSGLLLVLQPVSQQDALLPDGRQPDPLWLEGRWVMEQM